MKTDNKAIKRWMLPKPISQEEIEKCSLNYILQKVLIRRGIDLYNDLDDYITPSELPNPEEHFKELKKAIQRIIYACSRKEMIAICGDYDADGITSTVLLIEVFSKLGANVRFYIPSRQNEGYGLNTNMINTINSNNIKLIITVDNGISAFDAIKRSRDLGIDLIITDHHKLPDRKLDIFSLIHPDETPLNSPYKYLAGVGIAYLLANQVCKKMNYDINKTSACEFFCIGTVADMAPLKGANRKWLKEFLPKINSSMNKGIQSILKKLTIDKNEITSEDIGYKIAPLINAVGRIGDPKVIIELLTNTSNDTINENTEICLALNRERKRITSLIEEEALEIALKQITLDKKFLVITNSEWHPGVIGIVAARIADKFNLPTALLSQANDGMFRGSVRSNKLLKVNEALEECRDFLIAFGGHSDAAGFSINKENIESLGVKLDIIARRVFKNKDISKSINPEAHLKLSDINYDFYRQLMLVGPFGSMNPRPIFWSRKCRVVDIFRLKGDHIKIKIDDGTSTIEAIKWNESKQLNINDLIDIAFYIEFNCWKNIKKLQLNILDIKKYNNEIEMKLHNRLYKCKLNNENEVLITNSEGKCFSSDLSSCFKNISKSQEMYARKIFAFAETALGKAA